MYWFPSAALADYYNLMWFRTTQNCLTVLEAKSPRWVSVDWNQGVNRVLCPPEAVEKNLFPSLFQLLEATLGSLCPFRQKSHRPSEPLPLTLPLLIFLCFCHHIISFYLWLFCLPLIGTLVITEAIRIIQDSFPISRSYFNHICKISFAIWSNNIFTGSGD